MPGYRPRDPSGAGRDVEHQLAAFEREHFDQLVRERAANAGQSALVEFGRMRRVVEPRLMIVAVTLRGAVLVFVFVAVMIVIVAV